MSQKKKEKEQKILKETSKQVNKFELSKTVISKGNFIYLNLVFSFGPRCLNGFIADDSNIIQVFVCEVAFVLPLHFLMTLIGHYTQSSCVAIGWVQPVMAGYSFLVIVSSLLNVMCGLLNMRDVGVYLVFSIITGGNAFLDCKLFKSLKFTCIDYVTSTDEIRRKTQKLGHKFNTTSLVTSIFYNHIVNKASFAKGDRTLEFLRVTLTMIYSILTFVLPFLLFFLVQIRISKFLKIIKTITLVAIISYILLLIAITSVPGSTDEIMNYLLRVKSQKRFMSYELWMATLMRRTLAYGPLLVYHISFAGMLDPKANTEQVALESWLAQFILGAVKTMVYLAFKGSINRNFLDSYSLMRPTMELVLIYFPAATDFIDTGDSAILIIFYSIIFIMWAIKITLVTQLVFSCLTDIFPFAATYKKYIVATFFGLTAIISQFIFSSEDTVANTYWLEESSIFPEWVALLLFCIFTLWFYGVTNLRDDFHFKVGNPPSVFWKIFLWPLPFTFTLALALGSTFFSDELLLKYKQKVDTAFVILIVNQVLYALPFSISFFYEVIHYVLNKKLLWLVKPQERWGDPNPEERMARRKYPPRYETKFRRRFDYCKHRCLRYSKVLHALDEKEYDTRAALHNLPQELIEEKSYVYSILRRIRK